MTRALISTSTFPIAVDDGLPRFVYDLATALTKHCAITALVPDAPGAPRQERLGVVDVRRFTYFRPRRWQRLAYGNGILDNLRDSLLARLQPPPYLLTQARATRALVRELRVDVVNSHFMVPQGLSTALALGARRRVRHVLSVHDGDIHLLSTLPFGRHIALFVESRSDFIFADGSHARDCLDGLLGHPSGATLQPMGAWTGQFRGDGAGETLAPTFPEGHLVFCGGFVEKKGLVHLLRAMPAILHRHPGLGLIVIGYGPLEGELRRERARLGLERSVEFVGRRSHAEIRRYLWGSRLAVVPSIVDHHGETEGMPTVVVEVMASGTPVVGSAVDGIPDLIRHGENGFLCRPADPGDIAEKVVAALARPELASVAAAGQRTADDHDWSQIARRYAEAFRCRPRESALSSGG